MQAIEIAVATLGGLLGPWQVAATGGGIVAAAWVPDRDAFVADLARRLGRSLEPSAEARAVLEAAMPLLEAVVAGEPVDPAPVPLDLADRPAFDRAVLRAVQAVPWGTTASYGAIARRVGAPRAARAVGGAIGRNPVSLLVPCHRIIAADGTIGGYGGDGPTERAAALEHKRRLLLREGVTIAMRGG